MENKRPMHKKRIIFSLILATVIFASIFLITYTFSYTKYSSILMSQEKIKYNLLSLDLERQLLSSSCESFDPYHFSSELQNSGSDIGILEDRFGKQDKKVLEQKKIHTMLEVQHFLLISEHNDLCEDKIQTILFFYSNQENFINEAEKIGYLVGTAKNKDGSLMVYAFDYDLDSNLIKILKNKYSIEKPNILVINQETIVSEVKEIEDVEKYLD